MIKSLLLLGFIFLWTPLFAEADIEKIIVVTSASNVGLLSKQQIKRIYMDGGSYNLKPINLSQGNKTRIIFNSKVIGLTEPRINSYWVQMKFSGKSEPPLELDNTDAVINQLKKDPRAIAYFPQEIEIPSTLQVIYTLEY